ncbi:MAG: hypothetical protein JNM17_06855 [Archangium sp.]|nr:hypothetical protein [Archangium sp.]
MRITLVLVCGVLASGCLATRDRGASDWTSRAQTYKAPTENRCAKLAGAPANNCNEAQYLAQIYVRKLSSGDEVCLEGGFGDAPTGACLGRAAVVDTATNRILLEIRNARPESKWFSHEQHQFWFEEGALVDLYLLEHGY